MRVHKINNLNIVLPKINSFVGSVGIKTQYSAEQIVDSDIKGILGMTWVLIHKFSISDVSEEEMSAKEGLLLWCQKVTKDYDLKIENFHSSWEDGRAFCAIIHKHKPNLLDYYSVVKKETKNENLKLAFDVASDELGIPRLLEVDDFKDISKSDEKSVMTYVAYYWRTFASSKKNEIAGQRVAKLANRQRANEELQKDYDERAAELVRWIEETTQKYDTDQFGNNLPTVQGQFNDFQNYRAGEKIDKTKEKSEVENILSSLNTKLRSENAPTYEPAISPEQINSLWDNLNKVEDKYSQLVREALRRQKYLEALLSRFWAKVKTLTTWTQEKEQFLQEPLVINDIYTAQAKVKVHENYGFEYNAKAKSFDEANKMGQEIIESGHSESPKVEEAVRQLSAGRDNLEQLAATRKEALDAELAKRQQIEEKLLAFAKVAEEFNTFYEDEGIPVLSDAIYAQSVADVDALEEKTTNFESEFAAKAAHVQQARDLAAELAAFGVTENPYSRFNIESIENRNANLTELLAQKKRDIAAERQVQQNNAQLVAEYEALANGFIAYLAEQKAILEQAVEGSLEEQAQAVNKNLEDISIAGQDKLNEVTASFNKLVEARISEDTTISQQGLQVQFDQLKALAAKKLKVIEERIVTQKAGDITPEQLAEFRSAFDHFDKDKDAKHSKLELKACLASLGHDLSDAEIDKVLEQYDADGDGRVQFDEFVQYMRLRVRSTDSYDDVLESFRTIAGDKDYITEGDLTAVMPREQAQYLISKMPQKDGGYDYKAYVEASFTNRA
eukprot:GEZU01019384.1.p2 GENE.GEZU01019384.1~~GEZU01019384.1.p2  ORF type:complete len:787 (+),score=478.59 GEZU01019384.1:192-2552(+)